MGNEKILHLTLKKKWFDMILSGVKKEEYREIKMYWWKRLVQCGECYDNLEDSLNNKLADPSNWELIMAKDYDFIEFKNGYSKTARKMIVIWEGVTTGIPKPEWSDGDTKKRFKIKLGQILSTENC